MPMVRRSNSAQRMRRPKGSAGRGVSSFSAPSCAWVAIWGTAVQVVSVVGGSFLDSKGQDSFAMLRGGCEHAVMPCHVQPGRRNQRAKPLHEGFGVHHDLGAAIIVTASAIGTERQAALGECRSGTVAQHSFQSGAVTLRGRRMGVQRKAADMSTARFGRGGDR